MAAEANSIILEMKIKTSAALFLYIIKNLCKYNKIRTILFLTALTLSFQNDQLRVCCSAAALSEIEQLPSLPLKT
jgi:hypothetical protein